MKQLPFNERNLLKQFHEDKLTENKLNYLKGGDGGGGEEDPPPPPWNP